MNAVNFVFLKLCVCVYREEGSFPACSLTLYTLESLKSTYGDVRLATLTGLSLYLKAQYLNTGGIMKAFLCHICV